MPGTRPHLPVGAHYFSGPSGRVGVGEADGGAVGKAGMPNGAACP